MDKEIIIERTADVVMAFVASHATDRTALPELIASVGAAFDQLQNPKPKEAAKPEPAVDPSKSVKNDHIVSLIDGKRYKMLKRHLSTHGLTPDEYREMFGLPASYPMVAPDYTAKRVAIAKAHGLGRKPEDRSVA